MTQLITFGLVLTGAIFFAALGRSSPKAKSYDVKVVPQTKSQYEREYRRG